MAAEGAGAAGLGVSVKHAADRLCGWHRIQRPEPQFPPPEHGRNGVPGRQFSTLDAPQHGQAGDARALRVVTVTGVLLV